VARMQAGIQLKNHLYSKDFDIRCQYQQRWLTFPEEMKAFIKTNVSSLKSVFSKFIHLFQTQLSKIMYLMTFFRFCPLLDRNIGRVRQRSV